MSGKVVFVVGMGRSGTSVIAQWLVACGLGSFGRTSTIEHVNPAGNFEAEDMYDLHVALIRASGLKSWLDARAETSYTVPSHLFRQAQQVGAALRSSADEQSIMVKNPLASNFLPMWDELLSPCAEFVVVYRHPLQVVESARKLRARAQRHRRNKIAGVVRRALTRVRPSIEQLDRDRALRTWITTNQRILEWASTRTEPPIFVNSAVWPQEDRAVFSRISVAVEGLTYRPATSVLQAGFFETSPPSWTGDSDLLDEALVTYNELEALRTTAAS